jgi:hypothetical protein
MNMAFVFLHDFLGFDSVYMPVSPSLGLKVIEPSIFQTYSYVVTYKSTRFENLED